MYNGAHFYRMYLWERLWWRRAERHLQLSLEMEELFVALQGRHARTFPVWAPLFPRWS